MHVEGNPSKLVVAANTPLDEVKRTKAGFHDVCLECYWELQETYARRWESEFGDDSTVENPYELTERDRELREMTRTHRADRE